FDASSSENMGESGLPPVPLPNESTSIRSPSALFSAGSVLNDLNFSCLFIAGSVLDLNFRLMFGGSFAYVMKGVSMSLKQFILEIMASWMVT
ncbi:hypothetical protein S245_062629, partial [Arachis hypogaea]